MPPNKETNIIKRRISLYTDLDPAHECSNVCSVSQELMMLLKVGKVCSLWMLLLNLPSNHLRVHLKNSMSAVYQWESEKTKWYWTTHCEHLKWAEVVEGDMWKQALFVVPPFFISSVVC